MDGILVHEWLARTGGSENVFEHLTEIFPGARRFCLWNDSNGRFVDVEETFLARTPLRRSKAAVERALAAAPEACVERAAAFSPTVFAQGIRDWMGGHGVAVS